MASKAGASVFGLLAIFLAASAASAAARGSVGAAAAVPASVSTSAGEFPDSSHLSRADFGRERPSSDARMLADWVLRSGDSGTMPFAIVDKRQARVFVFDASGRLVGAAAALLGLARGDDSVPGIGERPIEDIRPAERTTPAGRFVAALDRNALGKEVLWVDYEDAISMHPVINTNPKERRPHRLATPTVADNRISFGCINVPAKFFATVVHPTFGAGNGVVYILPETKPASEVFGALDAAGPGEATHPRALRPHRLTAQH